MNQTNNRLHSSVFRRTVIAGVLIIALGITAPGFRTEMPVKAVTVQHSTAEDVVSSYYYYINTGQYFAAYQLWGSNFQSTHSYESFADGFANTQHDDLNIFNVTQRTDGTVKVGVTIYATETGSHISTYQGWYIVGPESGQLKLLSANIQRVA